MTDADVLLHMASQRKLSPDEIARLKENHPYLSGEYFDYLENVGWGEGEHGRMIYSGPIYPSEVYPQLHHEIGIVLLGDDFQGYCFGFDTKNKRYGELTDSGDWEPWLENEGFADYIKEE